MAWRGRQVALKCNTIEEFKNYIHGLNFSSWKPSGMVLHNTASPTLDQWWHGGTAPETRMKNLRSYYENQMGWSAGPHAFVDGLSIWIFTDFNVKGVHSPSWNGTRLGIEMVGDYAIEEFDSGPGAKVQELSEALFAETHDFFGWEPNGTTIKLHKEDPNTDHDCPGRKVSKTKFIEGVTQYQSDGGDHAPDAPPFSPVKGTVVGVSAGDVLNIRASSSSSSPIIGTADNGDIVTVVGEAMNGTTRWARLQVGDPEGTGVALFGWAASKYIQYTVVGRPVQVWNENITATVFGVGSDAQQSAYGGFINDNTRGVSLPYKWRGTTPRPSVVVSGPRGDYTCGIVDVGPWNINDPDYVLNGERPLVEEQYRNKTPAQNGQVPVNDAAIDLTGPVAAAVGISGKGKVRWRFANPPGDPMA